MTSLRRVRKQDKSNDLNAEDMIVEKQLELHKYFHKMLKTKLMKDNLRQELLAFEQKLMDNTILSATELALVKNKHSVIQ